MREAMLLWATRPGHCGWSRMAGTVLRFWNDDIIRDIGNVGQHIVIAAGLGSAS
jgi:very-short-patch-repair endonuclease